MTDSSEYGSGGFANQEFKDRVDEVLNFLNEKNWPPYEALSVMSWASAFMTFEAYDNRRDGLNAYMACSAAYADHFKKIIETEEGAPN